MVKEFDEKNIIQRIADLRQEEYMLEAYRDVRDVIINNMNYNAMDYHSADEEHDNTWFTVPDVDDEYKYPKYLAYKEMLTRIDSIMIGGKK